MDIVDLDGQSGPINSQTLTKDFKQTNHFVYLYLYTIHFNNTSVDFLDDKNDQKLTLSQKLTIHG